MENKADPIYGDILDTLKSNGEIVFVTYSMLDDIESKLRFVILSILQDFSKADLIDPIFSSIKELTTNALKANIKKILIDEKTITNPEDSSEVILKLKSVLTEKGLLEYAVKCKNYELSVRIHIILSNNNLVVKIINPIPLTPPQFERIQDKIRTAKNYDCLASFYMENPDPMAEGMGLGISMVIVLLKGIGYDVENFRVESDMTTKTSAILDLPL